MTDKIALVTGGSRGIGRAIALRLAADGACVIVNYRNDAEAAKAVVAAIESAGGSATAVQADVADPAQVRALFDAAETTYGGLDVLVHNAGGVVFRPIAEATDQDYDASFDINVRATFTALREAAARIRDNGRVIVISSAAARGTHGLYGASKQASEHLVRTFAQENGHRGITANSVRPGPTLTDYTQSNVPHDAIEQISSTIALRRLAQPEDIAEVVGFLASDAGRWVTGTVIDADGGMQ